MGELIDIDRLCECNHLRRLHENYYGCTVEIGKVVRGWNANKQAVFEAVMCPCKKYREKPPYPYQKESPS